MTFQFASTGCRNDHRKLWFIYLKALQKQQQMM